MVFQFVRFVGEASDGDQIEFLGDDVVGGVFLQRQPAVFVVGKRTLITRPEAILSKEMCRGRSQLWPQNRYGGFRGDIIVVAAGKGNGHKQHR